jgi:hypothetical protein
VAHNGNVSYCFLGSFFSFIDLSCAIEDVVEEEVFELFLTLFLVMDVQEITFSFADSQLLEFSFHDFLCLIFLFAFELVVENIERMHRNFSLLNEF